MDDGGCGQERRSRRAKLLMAAGLEHDGCVLAVTLRDLSPEGALVEGELALNPGTSVVLRKNELAVSGRIAWSQGRRVGIAFAAPLDAETVQRYLRAPKQRGSGPTMKKRPGLRGPMSLEERRLAEIFWGGPLPSRE